MPNPVNPNNPVGTTTTPNKYPQWGVKQTGTGGGANDYSTVKAANASQKQADMLKGYLLWFSSKNEASNFVSSQSGVFSGTIPNPISGLWGDLASGLDSGVIAVLNDIWRWIYPALEILAGVILIILSFGFVFKDDLLGMVPLAAAAAA